MNLETRMKNMRRLALAIRASMTQGNGVKHLESDSEEVVQVVLEFREDGWTASAQITQPPIMSMPSATADLSMDDLEKRLAALAAERLTSLESLRQAMVAR